MIPDVNIFRNLVLWLYETHTKPWYYGNETAKEIYSNHLQHVLLTFNNRSHLENCLPSENTVLVEFPDNTFLFLDPVTKGSVMVPTLHIKCNFGYNHPEMRIRIGLFLLDNDSLHSIGFRFESPEGKNDDNHGIHHYYHSQLIKDSGPQDACIEWLPVNQPALPLDADDPIKLLICVLVGLYGLDYLAEIRTSSEIVGLDRYIDDMFCHDQDPLKTYWLIEVGNPVRHSEYYCTVRNYVDFEREIRGKYPGCNIQGITQARYDSRPTHDQRVFN